LVLVCQPAGELGEQLREHAGHVCQGGDDRGGVGGIDEVVAGRVGAVDELADRVCGLLSELAGGQVFGGCI
jgi:hypothetical protein